MLLGTRSLWGESEGEEKERTYTAPPRQVVVVVSALVEGDEQVGALVAVGEREFGRAHLGSRCFCMPSKQDNPLACFLSPIMLAVYSRSASCACSQAQRTVQRRGGAGLGVLPRLRDREGGGQMRMGS